MAPEAWGAFGVMFVALVGLVGNLVIGKWKRDDAHVERSAKAELGNAEQATGQLALGFQMWEGLFDAVQSRLTAAEARCESLERRLDVTEGRAERAEAHAAQCEQELAALRAASS
jgi:hypothetical protein